MQLYLYEELLLLALRDELGTPASGAWYKQAIGAAILSELLLEQRLQLGFDGKQVELLCAEHLGEPLIDDCLDLVAKCDKPASLETWLNRFSNRSKLLESAAHSLCERGILSEQKTRFLWIFETRSYPELNHEPERLLIERLERAIFGDGTAVDPRTAIIISLADKTGLLQQAIAKSELKARRARIDAIIEGERVGEVTKKVIDASMAAIMVSTMIVPVMIH